MLQRGVLAFSAQLPGASVELRKTRTACALDLWLRMMCLLSEASVLRIKSWLGALITEQVEASPERIPSYEGTTFRLIKNSVPFVPFAC